MYIMLRLKEEELIEFIKMNTGYTTDQYFNMLNLRGYNIKYDTLYRKLRVLAKKGIVDQIKSDNTSYWDLHADSALIKSYAYYLNMLKSVNHPFLNNISVIEGGNMKKGSGYGWMLRKFIDAIKEIENID